MTAGVTPAFGIEVMNVNEINPDRCQAEIARLRNVAGGEDAIRRLDGCVADLVQTHAAKVALTAAPQLICMPYALRASCEEPSVMTATVDRRPPVPVVELKRAWHAVQAGQFRQTVRGRSANDQPHGQRRAVVDPQ